MLKDQDPRNLEAIWDDIEEYDLPEAVLNTASGKYITAMGDRLVSAVNHYSHLSQFEPEAILEVSKIKENIIHLENKRKNIINWHLANTSGMPADVKRNKDTMIAYVESMVGKEALEKIYKEIEGLKSDLLKKTEKLDQLLKRKESIQNVLNVGIAILNTYKETI